MQPENSPEIRSLDQFLTGNGLNYGFPTMQRFCSSSLYPMEVLDFTEKHETRASENHKEAERKRRERINSHLDSLRALLLCNSKTDKASLLAKVVQRVRELNQQTSEIMQFDQTFPIESDEITVIQNDNSMINGKSIVKASVCCEDRADLIPDLIEILKQLPFSPLRVEMVTLGGRIRNVIVLASDKDLTDEIVSLLKDALKRLVLRSSYNNVDGDRSKRRRIFDH